MTNPGRPEPHAQGTLEKRPLAHLLAYAIERRLTGSLVFGDPDAQVGAVVLKGGVPQKAFAQGASDPWIGLADLPAVIPFAYFDGYDALPDGTPQTIEPLAAVFRVLRRHTPPDHLANVLERLGGGDVRLEPAVQVETFGLEEAATMSLFRLKGGVFSLEQMRADPGLGAEAEAILYGLLITKQAHMLAPMRPSSDSSARFLVVAPTSSVTAMPAPSQPPDAEPSSGQLPPSSDSAGAAVGRVKLTRTRDVGHAKEERAVVSQYDERASAPPPPMAAKAGPTETVLIARRKEIKERAAVIDRQTFFEMLGISTDTPTAQVQVAFLAQAKRWHPDRLPPELSDVRRECARIFARLSEAASTLGDPEQRAKYMTLIDEGGATPEDQDKIANVLEAAAAFQKAEVMMKRGDTAKASELCAAAVKLDPQADYLALLAWCESMRPENQADDQVRRLEAKLTEAIERSPKCERAIFYRGNLRKKLNDMKGAMGDFRRAFELNPRNLDAQREVRIFEMRAQKEIEAQRSGSKPPDAMKSKPSFIGRLFKK